MLKRFTNACVKMVDRYLPDPFLFAIILTLFIFGAACVFTGTPEEAYADRALRTLKYWGDFKNGFWNLLKFSMQTSMIVVFGSTLAKTPLFTKLINSLAGTVSTEAGAIILTTVVSSVFSWLNYGLGLIVGALLGKAIAKRIKVDYPLLIAAAYSGFVIWHQGLSGSIPLTISTGFKVGNMNVVAPITDTIFNQWNLITVVACIIVLCIVNVAMRRDPDKAVYVDPSLFKEDDVKVEYKIETPADRMEHSKILWLLTVILGWAFLFFYFKGYADSGKSVLNGLGRDSVNFFLLFAGLLLHGDLRRYVDALKSSVSSVAGVILQYPFYAGIMAIMVGVDSQGQSLAVIISNFLFSTRPKSRSRSLPSSPPAS